MSDYIVFAGVNGAGKSTMYRSYITLKHMKRINSDEIIREFGGDWRNPEDQFKAGKIALSKIDEYMSGMISFNQETTLASMNAIRNSRMFKPIAQYHNGNKIKIVDTLPDWFSEFLNA